MAEVEWRPGSFTKNFSWGPPERGLAQLHEMIRLGFGGEAVDVPRTAFRERVQNLGRPDYIAINFFLFNRIKAGVDYLIADELVFQAIRFPHSVRFDRLALFAFNFSLVGSWKGAKVFQSRPALWAKHYIADRLGPVLQWDARSATADDIESFVQKDPRYMAMGARKLSTNLAYLYKQGNLGALDSKRVDRWWVDALFLALDRIIQTRQIEGLPSIEASYHSYLIASGFFDVAGRRSVEKDLASKHLVALYVACGGLERFDEEAVKERTAIAFQDVENYAVNNPDPIGVIHPSNFRIIKSLPRVCALLARIAGFEKFDIEDLENLDTSSLARANIERALKDLHDRGISPKISSEELLSLLRG